MVKSYNVKSEVDNPRPRQGSSSATGMPNAPPSSATGADPEQEVRAKLKKTFDSFDSDGSGEVSIEEITQLLISLGVSASTETIMACVKEADTDNSGEISFEEFYAAMSKSGHAGTDGGNGYGLHNSTFADLVRDATNAEDIGRTIEEANTRFLSTYNDLVVDIISSCQTEVLAAKVPLASYGRVKSALDTVTAELTGTAQDVLRKEFLQLRSSTIEFLTAQKLQLEESFKSRVNTGIDNIKRDAEKQVKEADKRTKLAEASVKKIEARFSEPQALVAKLEAQAQEANDKAVALEAKLAKYTDDWSEVYPKITALCSIQMHHAYRFAPILEVLTQRGIASAKQFYEKMDVKGDGKVTKQDFIQNMRSLGLSAEHLGDHELGQVFSDMDVDHSGTLSFKEVAAALQRWKRVHIPDSKSTKPRADDWMAKAFKSLAPEALGSRMLYLVQCYEENIRAREEKHTLEETISKEELVGKDAEWEKERKQLKAAKEEMETMLASERAEHLAEVTKLKETIEAASSKQTKTDKEDIDDLKKLIKKKQAEVRGTFAFSSSAPCCACLLFVSPAGLCSPPVERRPCPTTCLFCCPRDPLTHLLSRLTAGGRLRGKAA